MEAPKEILLVGDSQSYNLARFEEAASALGARVAVATDRCHVLADTWKEALGERILALDLREPEAAVARILAYAERHPLAAVLSVSDKTTEIAARAAFRLGLPHNPPSAARAARSKIAMRQALRAGGVRQPSFCAFDLDEAPERVASEVSYPCVVKPALLSGSRGVIRADDPSSFAAAWARVRAILAGLERSAGGDPDARRILVEEYLPGVEVALEGLLVSGDLRLLAIFDKPDPLEGPFFEETIYRTPSRLEASLLDAVAAETRAAVAALGLVDGPVHAELRLYDGQAFILEVAARTIGGLCGRALRFGTGMSLEELVVRHALRLEIPTTRREPAAAGAMMIPIPRAGVFRGVAGVDEARRVPFVEDVAITARTGDEVVPLPEGSSYLGFLIARGPTPEAVEAALREAHRALRFEITPRVAKG
jgi:biotin carboxylase